MSLYLLRLPVNWLDIGLDVVLYRLRNSKRLLPPLGGSRGAPAPVVYLGVETVALLLLNTFDMARYAKINCLESCLEVFGFYRRPCEDFGFITT